MRPKPDPGDANSIGYEPGASSYQPATSDKASHVKLCAAM
jgi:hypothetical protein